MLKGSHTIKDFGETGMDFQRSDACENLFRVFLSPGLPLFTSSLTMRGRHMSECSFSSCDSAAATTVVKHLVPFSNAL